MATVPVLLAFRKYICQISQIYIYIYIYHSFSIVSDARSKASSKTMPPYSEMQSILLQMRISSPVLKVIQ